MEAQYRTEELINTKSIIIHLECYVLHRHPLLLFGSLVDNMQGHYHFGHNYGCVNYIKGVVIMV